MTSDYNVIMNEAAAGGGLEGLKLRQQNNQFFQDLQLRRQEEAQRASAFQLEQQNNQIKLAQFQQQTRDDQAKRAAMSAIGAYGMQPQPMAPPAAPTGPQPLPAGANMGMQPGFAGPMQDRAPQMGPPAPPQPPAQQTGPGDPMQDPDIQGPLKFLQKVAQTQKWTPDELNEAAANIIKDRLPEVIQKRQMAARTQQQAESEQVRNENLKLREQANARQDQVAQGMFNGAPEGIETNPLGLEPDEFLKTLPKMAQASVKATAEGLKQWPSQYALARSEGANKLVAAVLAYDPGATEARYKAVQEFGNGKQGQQVRAFNAATNHLNLASKLSEELENGTFRPGNALSNALATMTGNPAPTNFNAVKQIVSLEIEKATSGTAGAVFDRSELQKSINDANSPAQLKGVISNFKTLMGGQLQALDKEYQVSTNGLKNFSDKYLTPDAKADYEAAASGNSPAPKSAGGPDIPQDIQDIMSKYGPQ